MSFIQREIDDIRAALVVGSNRHDELYAAQQALEWVLEPSGVRSPFRLIMGNEAERVDCLALRRPPQS